LFKRNITRVLKLLSIFPPLLIVLLSVIITSFVVYNNQLDFERESLQLKREYLKDKRLDIYNKINEIEEYIKYEYKDTEEKLKSSLKSRVNEAYTIIDGIIVNNPKLSKKEKVKLIKDALRGVRFNNGRGYYYIFSMKGDCVLLPIQSKLEGKSFLDVKDKRGKYITRSIINSLKDGKEEFMHWWWYKPSDINKQYKKISFNKYIPALDMYVGTGDYIEDFEFVIKQKVLDYLGTLKYDIGSYVFILDYDGNIILHPNKSILNKNIKSFNQNDKYNLKEIIAIAKLGEGYISYESNFFGLHEAKMIKTSFIKGLDRWNWAIGTGFYKNSLNEQITNKQKILEQQNTNFILKIIVISFIVTVILVLILYFNVKFLKETFERINKKIKKEIKLNNEKDKLLFHQSKMASLGEMLQNIAHQWRQPLSIVSTAASGIKIKKDYGILDDKSIDESVDTIMKSTTYLSKTIDDFRDFFKSDKKEEVFNISKAVKDSLDILNVKIMSNNIELIFEENDYKYLGFKNELIQVFMNILTNAIDAFDEKDDKKYIFINIYTKDDFVVISIQDSAGGIALNIIDRVFEPYFTTKHQAQGTGIGLYMSEEIVSKHLAGQISVENSEYEYDNEKYVGAKFIIKLPIKNLEN